MASSDGAKGGPPAYTIESLDNALRLLLLFEEQPDVRLTEASNYLGVASSTAHRLLSTLQYRGFVRQDPVSKAYAAGPALSSIAVAIMGRFDAGPVARPFLEELHRTFGETVHLGRLEGQSVTFIDSIEGSRAVRVGSREGHSLPAHTTSTGKAMLSTLEPDVLRALYPQDELPALTTHSITTWAALEAAVEEARQQGYATSAEESEDGVTSVAAPAVGRSGRVFALNISVPKHRMTDDLRAQIAQRLMSAAAELSPLLV
ncbi:MAG TPA: IclR family transcriptional regulator [Nocardioides sp.]|nr:IclR family transcriptional regulator [Nocardioides sp.]